MTIFNLTLQVAASLGMPTEESKMASRVEKLQYR